MANAKAVLLTAPAAPDLSKVNVLHADRTLSSQAMVACVVKASSWTISDPASTATTPANLARPLLVSHVLLAKLIQVSNLTEAVDVTLDSQSTLKPETVW